LAFEVQERGLGFSMVELLSICPTNWGMPPAESLQWLSDKMVGYYPVGDYKVHPAVAEIKL
jgi:2-oxoglutarate ferredoxin oxidoreductase subunit beta